ncbi:MAG: hypothetical protein ACE5H9_10500 [Anaerolineae bacterium]
MRNQLRQAAIRVFSDSANVRAVIVLIVVIVAALAGGAPDAYGN